MKLTTPRLILRPLKENDAKDVAKGAGNIEVSRWLLRVPHPYSLKDARTWIESNKKKWKQKKREDYNFGIELKEEKKIIGAIGIHEIDKTQGSGEVGYWLGENYHGRGYGTEALKSVVDFAFNKLNL